jgi:hypothetical protein
MLPITHHTRKRPSTGPRTTHGPQELDVLRVELAELQSRPTLLGACTSCPCLHEKIVELRSRIVSLEADLKVPIPTSFFYM